MPPQRSMRQMLFSGDHLWWNLELKLVVDSQRYCWCYWQEQLRIEGC